MLRVPGGAGRKADLGARRVVPGASARPRRGPCRRGAVQATVVVEGQGAAAQAMPRTDTVARFPALPASARRRGSRRCDHAVAGEQSRTGGKSISSARLPVARLQPSKAAGRPSRSLAKAISWLASQRQPSISATPLATQVQRSGMDAGGFPWVLWVVLLALQPALQVAGGDAADRHRGGEFGFAEAFRLVRVPASAGCRQASRLRAGGRSSTALCAASSRARSRSYCQRPISSQARSPNGSAGAASAGRGSASGGASWRARGLKARSDSQTSSQMPATNDDR